MRLIDSLREWWPFLRSALPRVFTVIVASGLTAWFGSGWVFFVVMYVGSVIELAWAGWSWRSFAFNSMFLGVFAGAMYLSRFHWLAALAFPVLLVVFFFYRRWSLYVLMVERCQAAIWGAPLKEFKEQGRKRPKIKFRLSKKR